jgi:hypothetical protein
LARPRAHRTICVAPRYDDDYRPSLVARGSSETSTKLGAALDKRAGAGATFNDVTPYEKVLAGLVLLWLLSHALLKWGREAGLRLLALAEWAVTT